MKALRIEVGDFFLITIKNGQEYEGSINAINERFLTIENWNEVKERLDEVDILLEDIEMLEGFNDSQTTL